MEAIVFWVLAALSTGGALGVVLSRDPVHSAMSLVGTLFCIASVFVMLHAHLLAALQVIVYAGAVMVLFVFIIMLLSKPGDKEKRLHRGGMKIAGMTVAGLMLFILTVSIVHEPAPEGEYAIGHIRAVAMNLFTEHVPALQLTALLLLAAVVGATVIAKRRI